MRTFVIGVAPPLEAAVADARLGAIASAGGSAEAFIVTTSSGATEGFVAALNEVRLSAQACQLTVPIDATVSAEDVWMTITDGDVLVWVEQVATCGAAGGFYFDPPPEPGATAVKVVLCPSTCTLVGSSPNRRAEIHTACTLE